MSNYYIMHFDRHAPECYCLIYDSDFKAPVSQVMTIEDMYNYLKEYYSLDRLAPAQRANDIWYMLGWDNIEFDSMEGVDCYSLTGENIIKTNRAGPLGENIPSWPEIFRLYDEDNVFPGPAILVY